MILSLNSQVKIDKRDGSQGCRLRKKEQDTEFCGRRKLTSRLDIKLVWLKQNWFRKRGQGKLRGKLGEIMQNPANYCREFEN